MAAGIVLIAGLGNPGPEYAQTRHNVGFWVVDAAARWARLTFRRESRFQGELCRYAEDGRECRLLKPLTFMNLSGDSVAAVARYYRIPPEQVLVAHDDLDLAPGTVRLKRGGGDGGHNGLKDITAKLGSSDYYRFRIGIGHPGSRELVTPYVLGRPSPDDMRQLEAGLDIALAMLPRLLDGEITRVMNDLNRRRPKLDAGTEDD